MPISRPACELIAGIALFLAGVLGARAAEPVVLADGLRGATCLAMEPTDAGSLRVLIAESGVGTLSKLTVLGESVISREELGPLPEADVTGLAFVGERCSIFTTEGVTSLALDEWLGEMKPPAGEPVLGPPASSPRWLYAPGADVLLRGRLALGRVTRLRKIERPGPAPAALTIAPEGYLVMVTPEGEGHRLVFLDPEQPEGHPASYPLEGLSQPQAMAYVGPANGADLLVIDGERGLVRIVSRSTERGLLAIAEPIDAPDDAVAFAPTPEGVLLVLTPSQLLRWRIDP